MSTLAILNSARKAVQQAKNLTENKGASPARRSLNPSPLTSPPHNPAQPTASTTSTSSPTSSASNKTPQKPSANQKKVAFSESTSENESSVGGGEVSTPTESAVDSSGDVFKVSVQGHLVN